MYLYIYVRQVDVYMCMFWYIYICFLLQDEPLVDFDRKRFQGLLPPTQVPLETPEVQQPPKAVGASLQTVYIYDYYCMYSSSRHVKKDLFHGR